MSLPIPQFYSVREVVRRRPGVCVLIAHDPMSGRRGRYTVVRLILSTGRAICIGRELPIGHAQRIAYNV
jgi:hypothetical protein